jgi:hypothetical protein
LIIFVFGVGKNENFARFLDVRFLLLLFLLDR